MEDLLKRLVAQEEENRSAIEVLKAASTRFTTDMERLQRQLDEAVSTVHRIEVAQAGTAAKMTCPAPGLCIELQKQVEKLTETMQDLVQTRAEARGAARVMVAMGSVFGAVAGALVTLVIHVVTKGKIGP